MMLLVPWISLASAVLVFVSPASSLPSPINGVALECRSPLSSPFTLVVRDDSHGRHKGAPLLQIDEAEVLSNHQPTPPSYYTADWEDDGHQSRHGGLIIAHGIFMGLAFFVSWPLAIVLRSVKHPTQGLATLSFYILCALGCAASGLYRKMTPDMYEHAVHRSQGYAVILFAISLSVLDIMTAIRRIIAFTRSSDRSFGNFWRMTVQRKDDQSIVGHEYSSLDEDPEEIDLSKGARDSVELQNVRVSDERNNEQWENDQQRRYSASSEQTVFGSHLNHSDDTLHDPRSQHNRFGERLGLISRIGHIAFMIADRALVFAGYGQFIVGIVTYTGGCRQNYLNGCLAHLIKGSIFWCYGLATFGRFLGVFANMGWAWNRSSNPRAYSAEFVESLVIFTYGITNTWMERFGAHPGDPYTTRQIQHISIAVMFWFAGLIGMGVESRVVRNWLASSWMLKTSNNVSQIRRESLEEPPSYRASFNPFPALVIGITGSAMAAHAQVYLFQVQIHSLWGNLLVASSVLRCLTYFFLWLGPPKSILPSRPPTEALGSFFLACGGLVFMFSTEEVTLAAMRRERDDVMMFLNVAVAITCFAFCWVFYMIAFKAWLKSRIVGAVTYRNA